MAEQVKKKRKISLNTVGIVLFIVLVFGNIYAFGVRSSAQAQIQELQKAIGQAQEQAALVPAPVEGLETKLETAQAGLDAAKEGFPRQVDRNEAIDYILGVASESNVQVLPLVSEGWTSQNLGQEYNVLNMSVSASGSLGDIKNFITVLQNGRYPNLAVSGFNVQKTGDLLSGPSQDSAAVSLSLVIYIYTAGPGEGSES